MSDGAPHQLALALGHRPALGAGDFLVAPANRAAVAWVDRWPDWPAPGLVIAGPPGSGKSHLVAVWRARSGAAVAAAEDLAGADPARLLADARALAVEDIERCGDERVLLHLYNMIAERGGSLLLSAARMPAQLRLALPDLASRIGALPVARLSEPDDALLAAVLVKLFADRQLAVPAKVVEYLTLRMERSFDAARRLVATLDARALALGRPITVPLARAVMEGASGVEQSPGGV